MPPQYRIYTTTIESKLLQEHSVASRARALGLDPTLNVEADIAFDLPDRVSKLINVPIADELRQLLETNRTEAAAIIAAERLALGKYPLGENQDRMETAVRLGVAIITDGVTVAPIQGITAVRAKRNKNNTEYLSVEFAGPMRSAGGTESALTLVIADRVRKTLGLERYIANSFDDETGRFLEELRIYEREVGNFQYKVTDEDVRKAIENLPVEIDGVWTDDYEVVLHRNMERIATNKLRGGALRVLNDGLIGKSKKLLKLLRNLNIQGWDWLGELSGGNQRGSEETKTITSHFDDVISGRPVISMPGHEGGFRLRYGRAPNTGLHTIGIHPALFELLDYPVVVGTQIKVSMPGKAATVAPVDTIESPLVKLQNGSVIRLKTVREASAAKHKLHSVIHLGDILVSFGDFLENNHKLAPSGYVEEWWALELSDAIKTRYASTTTASLSLSLDYERIQQLTTNPVTAPLTFSEAVRLSTLLQIPLHPRYLLFWDKISPQEAIGLRENIIKHTRLEPKLFGKLPEPRSNSHNALVSVVVTSSDQKALLEKLGVEHNVEESQNLIIGEPYSHILQLCLATSKDKDEIDRIIQSGNWDNTNQLVSLFSGIEIRSKSSVTLGVRVGRPEKAMQRRMRPPVDGLFPIGRASNNRSARDILLASEKSDTVQIEIANLRCPKCQQLIIGSKCSSCDVKTAVFFICDQCSDRFQVSVEEIPLSGKISERCAHCNGRMRPTIKTDYQIRTELASASSKTKYKPIPPLRGVLGLSSLLKIPERLEKALLRQKYGLSVYRDGTIRYDATNLPLTHFRPCQILGPSVEKLKELGYTKDANGKPLESDNQLLELFSQDIVIPVEAGTFFVSVARYLDDLLSHHYGMEPYYKITDPNQLLGELVVGLAPHTSVGIVGRIIGFTNAQACFASPYWHSAKRRDCDGDGDSIILLLDALLNFSKRFLPAMIGGLMDAPLLVQPLVLPKEVQRQAHHMDVSTTYPREFYEASLREASPTEVEQSIETIGKRLDTPNQYMNFSFTHDTSSITVARARASYSTLNSLTEKLDRQIELANKIRAVNVDEVVKSVLKTHLLPDIIGNTKAFTAQRFRCKKCGTKYRRATIKGVCLMCGGELQSNVTRGSVQKYLQLGLRLASKYDVGDYLRSRFVLAAEELATLFKPEALQKGLEEFETIGTVAEEKAQIPKTSVSESESTDTVLSRRNENTTLVAADTQKTPRLSNFEGLQTTIDDDQFSESVEGQEQRSRSRTERKEEQDYQTTLI